MKNAFLIIVCILISVHIIKAQTPEQIREYEALQKEILYYDECFKKLSQPEPHTENIILESGKIVSTIVQSDYERSVFVSADELLEDMILWKNSPYLWRQKHKKQGKVLSDDRDLAQWQLNSIKDISLKYFESGGSTFHIVAHGLIHTDTNTPANKILVGGQELDAKETAEMILLSWNGPWARHADIKPESWDGPYQEIINCKGKEYTIVVHSCHSAEGENNFAQQLSIELAKVLDNVSVVGAPDTVYCEMDEKGNYSELIASEYEIKNYDHPKQKRWKVYKNGQDTGQGDYDYVSTVKNIQSK